MEGQGSQFFNYLLKHITKNSNQMYHSKKLRFSLSELKSLFLRENQINNIVYKRAGLFDLQV